MSTTHAVSTPTPTAPLPVSTPTLFRPEFPLDDVRCLPFVRELSGKEAREMDTRRLFWACPRSKGYSADCNQGVRFAAAYLLFIRQRKANSPLLSWIVRDMARKDTRGFKVGFLCYVEAYARGGAELCTASAIEAHANAVIAHDEETLRAALAN